MTLPSYQTVYDKFYPADTQARRILEQHSRSVADLAIQINEIHRLGLDPQLVETAAMLHDIGIFLCNAPSIHCHGLQPYLRHGIIGADLLRRHGYSEEIARVAERHTGTGIYPAQALELQLPRAALGRILYPETTLERLICYADKFYSKSGNMQRKPLSRVVASLAKFGQESIDRFQKLHDQFAIE